jgi:hypothetical protein
MLKVLGQYKLYCDMMHFPRKTVTGTHLVYRMLMALDRYSGLLHFPRNSTAQLSGHWVTEAMLNVHYFILPDFIKTGTILKKQ